MVVVKTVIIIMKAGPFCGQSLQGAYSSGKPGNLREFVNSGKLWEFERYSENFCKLDAIF